MTHGERRHARRRLTQLDGDRGTQAIDASMMQPFIAIEPRTSRRAWIFLAFLPVLPVSGIVPLMLGFELVGVDLLATNGALMVVVAWAFIACCWQWFTTLWVVGLAISLALKERSAKPLLLAVPSIGIGGVMAVTLARGS